MGELGAGVKRLRRGLGGGGVDRVALCSVPSTALSPGGTVRAPEGARRAGAEGHRSCTNLPHVLISFTTAHQLFIN